MDAILKRLHERAAALSGTLGSPTLSASSSGWAQMVTGAVDWSAHVKTVGENETENSFAGTTKNGGGETCMREEEAASMFESIGTDTEDKQVVMHSSCCPDLKTESGGASVTDSEKSKQGKNGFACELCLKSFKWPTQLQAHLDKKHPEAPKKCETCGKKFSWSCQLPSHSCHAEVRTTVQYECPICKKVFPRAGALKLHKEEHPELRTYTCSQCHKAYSNRAHLIAHLREIHGEDSPEYVQYQEELRSKKKKGKDFRNRLRRFTCQECGKVYRHAYELADHMNTHTGDKPYQCRLCGKSFSSKSILTGHHRYVHVNERPSSCSVCGKAFKTSDALKKHVRTHTGEKPFACELCDKTFTQKVALTKHMVIHTKEKPWKCVVCGVAYSWRQSLRQHMAKCHSEMQQQSGTFYASGEQCNENQLLVGE